jgi:acetyl-CoA carboxylase carboxyltransferase component
MFVTGANIDVPLMTIITRKGYGLGVMAMAGGSFMTPLFPADPARTLGSRGDLR